MTLAERIVFSVYSVLIHFVCLLGLPWLLVRAWKSGKLKDGFGERFGNLKKNWVDEVAPGRPIWIHAVSVGEAQMLGPLLEGLTGKFPGVPIVVSTNTVPGQTIANTYCEVSGTFFVPLDLGWAVRRSIRKLKPRLLLIMETEIWPNLILGCAREEVPVVFINGRISDRSFPGYLKMRRFLFLVLARVSAFGMQSAKNAERIVALGALEERVFVMGNLKFESARRLLEEPSTLSRREFGIGENDLVLIGGSTFPGEEEMLIRIYNRLRKEIPNLRLILAPRHPQRFDEARAVIEASGHEVAARGGGAISAAEPTAPPIVLLDVMGELKHVYRFCDVVFIGKSMGFTEPGCGGQNPLEPAVWKRPILCGPRMENFREVFDALSEVGGIETVSSEEDLFEKAALLLKNTQLRIERGGAAYSVIESSLGAVDRCLEMIERVQ
jgi:3-deoxy-D-manno-octulosonic-acid transferase